MSKTCRFRKGLAGVLVVSFLAACVPYQGTSAAEGEWVKYYKNTYYKAVSGYDNTIDSMHGTVLTGLNEIDGNLYYFREDGRLINSDYGTNIYNYDGVDYYYEPGTGKLSPLSEYTGLARYYKYLFYYVNGEKQTG